MTDNVTPIGPHATASEPTTSQSPLDSMAERVATQRARIFQAMGIISCAAAAAPENTDEGEPEIRLALDAAYSLLDDVCMRLDSSVLETEVAHA